MKNIITKSILSITSIAALASCGQAPQMIQQPLVPQVQVQAQERTQTHEMLIRFNSDAHRIILDRFFKKYNLKMVGFIPELNTHIVRVTAARGFNLQAAMVTMQNEMLVDHIEENQRIQVNPVYQMGISPIITR